MTQNYHENYDGYPDDDYTEDYLDTGAEKNKFTIPLMLKKQNSIEKYIKNYKHLRRDTNQDYSKISIKKSNTKSVLSGHASNLLLGKLTPDPNASDGKNCYVKYIPVKDEQTQTRMEILDKIQLQYQRLKNNIESKKQQSPEKYFKRKPYKSNNHRLDKTQEISQDKIKNQLKKAKIQENGKKYFADLYMLEKARSKIKNQVYLTHNRTDMTDPKKQEEEFVSEKMNKERQSNKKKFFKNKGILWNVYYEMHALSDVEKKNIKVSNRKFYKDYGPA